MGLTNFPNGISSFGVPVLGSGELTTTGNVFFVDSGAANASDSSKGTDKGKPLATLDEAVSRCSANNGDIVVLMPGHAETISNATDLSFDVAGVNIIALGEGTARPKFIFDTATTATIAVSGANISVTNCVFSANFADIAELFTPTAVNFKVIDCKFTQEAVNMNFIEIADTSTTDNQADGLTFIGCEWIEPDVSSTSLINVDADLDRLVVEDCYIDLGVNGVISAIAEVATGKDLTNVSVKRNYVSRLVTAAAVQLITFTNTTTTNTGIMESNRCRTLDIAGELLVSAGTNISFFDNLSTAAIDKSGYVLPAIDS